MGAIVKLLLCAILCASVQGVCRRMKNEDMIEYSCMGGHLSDLDNLPISTGKIRISNMPIRRITANTFSRFGLDLWVLGCSYCGIIDIEPGAFQRLSNLQQLSLNNNHLTTVKESWFKGLNYLTYLDLNYNNIESIEDGVFLNLPSLVELRLSGNRLECLNLVAMSQLKDLKRIFISENSELKCPNAISIFLENRGITFQKDPEWSRLPNDLIAVTIPLDYNKITTIKIPIEPYFGYHRKKLDPTTTIPTSTMTSTLQYITPKFQTTEEVIYRPNLKTTFKSSMIRYEDKVKITQSPSYEYTRAPYISQKNFPPIESATYLSSSREMTQDNSQDTTTFRSWPTFSESTSARIEYPIYPPHKNEDKYYTKQPDYSSPIDSFSLAPNQDDHHQMSSVELNMKQTMTPYRTDSLEKNIIPSNVQYPPSIENRLSSIDSSDTIRTTQSIFSLPEIVQSAHPDDIHSNILPIIENVTQSMDFSNSTRIIQSIPYSPPSMVHPAQSDNIYQPPYYESTITVHSPPLMDNKSQQKEVNSEIVPIETTTDKPLPECPTRNLSSSNQSSIRMIIVSVLLMITSHILVERFN